MDGGLHRQRWLRHRRLSFHGKLLVHRKNMRSHLQLSNQPKKAGLAGACSQQTSETTASTEPSSVVSQRQRLQLVRRPLGSIGARYWNGDKWTEHVSRRDSNQPTLPSPNPCAHLSVMPESSLSVRPGRFSATRGLSRRSSVHGLSSPETTNLMLNYFIASNMLIISMCRTYTVTTTTALARHT